MMADDREPPPFFDDEETTPKEGDDEDLFSSAVESPQSDTSKKAEFEKHLSEDLFASGGEEVSLDNGFSSRHHQFVQDMDSPSDPPKLPTSSTLATTKKSSLSKTKDEIEEESSGDQFIEITITDPQKIGDGINAYIAYKVCTKTNIPAFRKSEFSALRRFSDFLGLHDKLVEKHLHIGRIVPPAPEKSVMGMTKIKMSKEESVSMDFVEKRRAALERYLNRTAAHPVLLLDPDFREFLELQGELPKATNTSALSGAGVLRLFTKVGDTVNKMTYKMEESDLWFEEKQQQIDNLDIQLRRLHGNVESLVQHRKELALSTASFAKSAAMLSNCEEHTALSRALSQLAEVEEKIEQLQQEQANVDFYVLSELLKDYVTQIIAIKSVFHQRVKVYHNWQTAKATLTKKRENKAKLELAGKTDKFPQARDEVLEWEGKVDAGETEFENISKMIRKEMERFEKIRVKDFKVTIIKYMESLMNTQQQLIKYWEAFLPEAKAIA